MRIALPALMTPRLRRPRPLAGEGFGWILASLLVVAVVLAPIGGLVYFAGRGSGGLWPHLVQYVLPHAVRTTVLLLLGVGAMVAALGVGAAWLVTMYRFPGRRTFQWALLLPLAVPTYIVAFAYLDVMHPVGPVQTGLRALLGIDDPRGLWFPEIRSLWGAVVLLGLVLYPYVYLPVRALFAMQSASVLEVARTLGSSRAAAFRRVAVPLARPAIAVGVSLALMEALNDIGAAEFLGVRTLTVAIYTTWLNRSSVEGAAQIALVMLVVVVGLIALERWARRRQRYSGNAQRSHSAVPSQLSGMPALAASFACALPVFFGFVVPAGYLAVRSAQRISVHGLPPGLGSWIANSVTFAALATLIAVAVGLLLAYSVRLSRGRAAPILFRLAGIGYAVPGTVLAVGLLVPLARTDNLIDQAMQSWFGVSTGLLLTGSGAALVVAYVIRFLAVSSGSIEAGLAKLSPHLDMAARSLGSTSGKVLRRIHMPLLKPAIAAGAILVFVDCMKELPATLLLRPFNFETLSTYIYGEAARGTYENGAVAALAIVLVGLVPVIVLARMETAVATRLKRRSSSPGRPAPQPGRPI